MFAFMCGCTSAVLTEIYSQLYRIFPNIFNQFFIFFLLLLPNAMPISFNFPSFNTDNSNLILQGDAYTNPDGLQLTKDTLGSSIGGSVGRALYHEQVHLWDKLQTSPRTSPLSLKLLISLLLMGLLSSSHHLILRSLKIQQAGFLDCLVMKPLSTALKIKLLPLSLTPSKTGGTQVLLMSESISIPLSQT